MKVKTKKIKLFNPKVLISIIIFVIFTEVIILSLSKDKPSIPQATQALQKYAAQVLTKCSTDPYRPTCYETEIPKLMDIISMEDAFKVTSFVQDQDKDYRYCHVLGHNLSAREIDKDPTKWKDAVSRCPSGICSNGCIHGGFQERFRAESFTDEQIGKLKPDLIDLCEERQNWHPTKLEQASCYHALGHLTMYLTSADIGKSIELCEEIAVKNDGRDYSHLCFDGVFMQIFQPLEPEDFALVKGKQPTKDNVDAFCSKYANEIKGSCISESWPLFSSELKKPDGLVRFCSRSEPSEQDRCYSSLFYVLTAQFQFDQKKISDYCKGLPTQRSGLCFANASSRMIETDYRNISKAVELCNNSIYPKDKDQCLGELLFYSTYNFHAGSEEFLKLCNALPQPWKTKCLNKTK